MTPYTQHQNFKYSAAQLFDLVADVERYPEFMPWVIDARIQRRDNHTIMVDMAIAAGPLRKWFSTVAILDRPHRIDIGSRDPIFDRFEQRWIFAPAANGGANVEYHVDFRFRSRVLQLLMGASFADRAVATMSAFKRRAHRLYDGQSGP